MDGQASSGGNGESLVQELLRYVRFSEEDARLLRVLRPLAAPHFERIATAFYDRIREHDGAHEVFTGEPQIKRLQGSMVRWMDRLCAGPHDEAYFKKTREIGRIHVQIGLPQRYMFTAMALIRVALLRVVDEAMGDEARACREALDRALDIELAVMLESYRDHSIARAQQRERLERAEVDLALRRTEHRYVSAVELARVLIVGLDREGRIRLFNREAERVTAHEPRPGSTLEHHETHEAILHLIDRLPHNQQEVIRLKFQNGFSYKEISRITSLSIGNVGFLIHTAIHTLRREWAAQPK